MAVTYDTAAAGERAKRLAAGFDWASVNAESLELFKTLLRADTVNPPGNEQPLIESMAAMLRAEGFEPEVFVSGEGRANLVARLRGGGKKAPLLLAGHVDVVPFDRARWKFDPLAATEAEGHIWARGTVDMKNMIAMSMMTLRMLKRSGAALDRDVIFCAVSDEENGCDFGSKYMVEEHPEKVRAEYMLGEIGGFTLWVNGKALYPIQVAEKGVAWLKMTARGEPGHGSMPHNDSAVVKLARAIEKIGSTRLPMHKLAVTEHFIRALAATQPTPKRQVLLQVLNPLLSNVVLDRVLPDKAQAASLNAALRNTASPTVFGGGGKTNVIPGEASIEIDGRILPGQTVHSLVAELERVTGDDVKFEVIRRREPVLNNPDTELMRQIEATLVRHDPAGIPIHTMVPGFTDAQQFSRLGMTCYGFSPLKLPQDAPYTFSKLFHGDNERIPIDGYLWGQRVLFEAVAGFCAR